MKYLKLFESSSEREELVADVNDMLLELNDDGFRCSVSNPIDPNLPAFTRNTPDGYKLVKTHDIIQVNFSKSNPGWVFDDIREVYHRIQGYLNDTGYIENEDFEKKLHRIRRFGPGQLGYFQSSSVTFKKPCKGTYNS